jgi:hypothetical protein
VASWNSWRIGLARSNTTSIALGKLKTACAPPVAQPLTGQRLLEAQYFPHIHDVMIGHKTTSRMPRGVGCCPIWRPMLPDVGQHLGSEVEINRRLGWAMERAPNQVEQVAQGFERIVEPFRRHGPCRMGRRTTQLQCRFVPATALYTSTRITTHCRLLQANRCTLRLRAPTSPRLGRRWHRAGGVASQINGEGVPTNAVWGGQAALCHFSSATTHQPSSSVVASANFVCSRAPSTIRGHKRRTDVVFKLIRGCLCLTDLRLDLLFDKAPQVQCFSPTCPQLLRGSCHSIRCRFI